MAEGTSGVTGERRAAFVLLLAAALASGCGGASETDASDQAHTNDALPPGGTAVPALVGDKYRLMIDEAGVFWLWGCEGLYAVLPDQTVKYDWTTTPLPELITRMQVDSLNRKWFLGVDQAEGSALHTVRLIEGGEWRTVLSVADVFDLRSLSVDSDGHAWVLGYDESGHWVQELAPHVGERISVPDQVDEIAAGGRGSLWAQRQGELFHWDGRSWHRQSIPSPGGFLRRDDARRGGVWLETTPPARVRWTGDRIELEPLPVPEPAQIFALDTRGHARALDINNNMLWVDNGVEYESWPLVDPSYTDVVLGPDGDIYVQTLSSVWRYHEGEATLVLEALPLDEEATYPWRSQPFSRALLAPSLEVSAADLIAPSPHVLGAKIHVTGAATRAYQMMSFDVDGNTIPRTTLAASTEFAQFASERSLRPVTVFGQPDYGAHWELYGYLETGACYDGQKGNRQLWLVEGYPSELPPAERDALRAELRARHPD
jgi:hypothetical protein